MQRVDITSEYITLAAFLKFCGAADSGGQAGALVAEGRVSVNGQLCRQRGKKLRAGDVVALDGQTYEVCAPCI